MLDGKLILYASLHPLFVAKIIKYNLFFFFIFLLTETQDG